MDLTKQQQITLKKKGGAAVIKKLKMLEKKIGKGSASDKDQAQFDQLMDRSLKLIDAELNGTIEEKAAPQPDPAVEESDEKELAKEYYNRRIANLQKFKIDKQETHMFSHKLGRKIWVVSTDDQRLLREKGDDEVWTINEALVLAQKERTLAMKGEELQTTEYEAISMARKLFDGELTQ